MTDTTTIIIAAPVLAAIIGASVKLALYIQRRKDVKRDEKDRAQEARFSRIEGKCESMEKDITVQGNLMETVSKRLQAGAETFKKISDSQEQLQKMQFDFVERFASVKTCDKREAKCEAKFERHDVAIDGIKEDMADVKQTMRGMSEKLSASMSTISKTLSNIVELKNFRNQEAEE